MTNHVLGVDISKASLDVHLAPTGETQQFANSTEGFRRLIAWLRDRPVSRVVYEPTGPWHRGECQKVWGSAGFVRIYGHMIHTDGQPTPLWQSGASTGIVERVIDTVVDKQFASVNNVPPEPWTGQDTRDRGMRCLIAPHFLALSKVKTKEVNP